MDKNYDVTFDVAHDFIGQLEEQADKTGISQTDLANALGVTTGRVSQILRNPGNLTLNSIVKTADALGLQVCIITYEKDDKNRSPIPPEIFRTCWELAGMPRDLWSVKPHIQTNYTLHVSANIIITMPVAPAGYGFFAGGPSLLGNTAAVTGESWMYEFPNDSLIIGAEYNARNNAVYIQGS